MDTLSCRYCKRSIAVPGSKCPWCGEKIMVICAHCKAYTDDQSPLCMHCNQPLQADDMQDIVLQAHHPDLARMVDDRRHARQVASAIVLHGVKDFFYATDRFQTVLADLFGATSERGTVEAGVVFSAYAYLCQEKYCAIRLQVDQQRDYLSVNWLRDWDGQQSVEGELAEQIERALTTAEATEKMIRSLMGFRLSAAESGSLGGPMIRDVPDRSAFAAVAQVARNTVLPEGDLAESRRVTYQLLAAFVKEDRRRAQALATETKRLLRDFESYT
jgi:RNA polymerase subunit RPABC4/transcription elongation factor Spt4